MNLHRRLPKFRIILIGLSLLLSNCILIDIEANLQTNLIPRSEALDKVSNVSWIRFIKCLNQSNLSYPSDVIQINATNYTGYLSCKGACSSSVYYRKKDIEHFAESLLILPCDTDSIFLIPKVQAFEPNDFELKYFGF